MNMQKVLLVIFITIAVVIILNLVIISYAKKRGASVNMFTKVYRRARNPWEEDNQKMKELADHIARLKNTQDQEIDRES